MVLAFETKSGELLLLRLVYFLPLRVLGLLESKYSLDWRELKGSGYNVVLVEVLLPAR